MHNPTPLPPFKSLVPTTAFALCALGSSMLGGCGKEKADTSTTKGGYATGKVTMEDGRPLTGDIDEVSISVGGISEAGEKVHYNPIVKDGVYKQKLVPGQFRFSPASIKVKFGGNVFTRELTPVGSGWDKHQDSAAGIVQDYVWKPSGLRETYGAKADPNNATHWHGMNVGMRFQGYRSDISKPSTMLPEGTKLVFVLTPTSKSIDGRDLQPLTIERDWLPKAGTPNDDLHDLPPANYELTGTAKLPDGTTRPILLQGKGDYPKFTQKGIAPLERDNIIGGFWKQPFGWVTD